MRIFEDVSCKSRVPRRQDCSFEQVNFARVLPQGHEESIFCAASGCPISEGGDACENESSGNCLRSIDWACGDGHGNSQPGEKRGRCGRGAQDYALWRFEMDADHKGMRSCGGVRRPE